MKHNKWPEFVPILSENDICKGSYKDGKKGCLSQWVSEVFGYHSQDSKSFIVRKKLLVNGRRITKCNLFDSIEGMNDNWRLTKRQIAEIWNETMKDLEYTEIIG